MSCCPRCAGQGSCVPLGAALVAHQAGRYIPMGGTTIRRDHRASATGGDKSKVAVTVLQDGVAVTPTIIVGRGDTTAAAREMIAAVNEAAAAGVDPVTSGAGQAAAYAGAQAAQQSSNQRLLLYGALGVAALAGLFIVRKKR